MRNHRALWLLPALVAATGCGDGITSPSSACSIDAATGIAVAASDVYGGTSYALGYPPYAIDGCRLVYVAPAGSAGGALRLRDLATGHEETIADAAESPRRPSIAGQWITWEADVAGVRVVRVRGRGDAIPITGPFDHAGEPRAAADAIVFTAWLGPGDKADADIYLYRPETQELAAVGATPGQQRFPDISATHVVWSDFAEDPDGTFDDDENDAADLVLYDRGTSAATTRRREGKQAFAMLGADGKLAYLDWNLVHPEPKLTQYELRVGDLGAPVEGDLLVAEVHTLLPYVRPVAHGARIAWVEWPNGGAARVMERPASLAAPAKALPDEGDGADLVGPIASDALTLVGVRASDAPVKLRAFAK